MKTVSTKSAARIDSDDATTGPGCRPRHALGGRRGVVALEHRDQAHDHAEHRALDDAVDDVGAEVDHGLHVAPERAGVDADQLDADQVGPVHAQRREQRGEQRHRDHAAPEARRDDARERIDRHHLHRGKLLRRLHEADLGGDRAARAAREQQAGDDRPQLAHQRQRDQDAERLGGAVALQHVVALQREHHPDEQARHQDDHERQHAGEIDLAQREPDALQALGRVQEHREGEARREAQARDRAARAAADAPQSVGDGASGHRGRTPCRAARRRHGTGPGRRPVRRRTAARTGRATRARRPECPGRRCDRRRRSTGRRRS